jgi:hypothetical protein
LLPTTIGHLQHRSDCIFIDLNRFAVKNLGIGTDKINGAEILDPLAKALQLCSAARSRYRTTSQTVCRALKERSENRETAARAEK